MVQSWKGHRVTVSFLEIVGHFPMMEDGGSGQRDREIAIMGLSQAF